MTNLNKITLKKPIKRGKEEITSITVREPGAGDLRGVSLAAVSELDVSTLIKIAPRITTPAITDVEANAFCLTDLMKFGKVIVGMINETSGNDTTPKP